MDSLRLLQTPGAGEKCAEKNTVSGIGWRNIDGSTIPALRNAKSASMFVNFAETVIDQVEPFWRTQANGTTQCSERLSVTRHITKRVSVVEPDDPVLRVSRKVVSRQLDGAADHTSIVESQDLTPLGFGFISWHSSCEIYA